MASYPTLRMALGELDRMRSCTADERQPPSPQHSWEQMSPPDHPQFCFRALPAPSPLSLALQEPKWTSYSPGTWNQRRFHNYI